MRARVRPSTSLLSQCREYRATVPPDFICVRKRIREPFLRSSSLLDSTDRSSGIIYSPNERRETLRAPRIALTIVSNIGRFDSLLGIDCTSNIAELIYIGSLLVRCLSVFLVFRLGESRKWRYSCERYVINGNLFPRIMVAYASVIVVSSY